MLTITGDPTPLELTDTRITLVLGHVLWSWPLCSSCVARRTCTDDECNERVLRCKRYSRFYKGLIDTYIDEGFDTTRIFKTHEDLFAALQTLKTTRRITKAQLAEAIVGDRTTPENAVQPAICLVVKVLTMIDCSSSRLFSSPNALELARFRTSWREYVPFCDYIEDLFPKPQHAGLGYESSDRFGGMKAALRAHKLKKRLRLTLRRTHDLRDHLQFDKKNRILDIFHLTTFLKEQLRDQKSVSDTSHSEREDSFADTSRAGTEESTSHSVDILPRQLLLETLSSVQHILFPPTDHRARHLLRTLISSADFDPDAARYTFAEPRRYVYLAERWRTCTRRRGTRRQTGGWTA
ncbi:hypothetical protein NLG97_g1277 [Lecanicillium saksenae]|uniref:Uncharacterized protein n=1 Tax=Lecanicillium saksenae TaxID=468837 RepID=A0ACC1R646_9HYPO|nr:hypothetical protein NLG97_g1277 [Lecanicillium saksenae]